MIVYLKRKYLSETPDNQIANFIDSIYRFSLDMHCYDYFIYSKIFDKGGKKGTYFLILV